MRLSTSLNLTKSHEEAIDGIKEVHGFVGLYITSDLIEAVEEKITLIDSGKLSGVDAVEAVHLLTLNLHLL